jgi:predicted ATPase
MEFIKSIRLDGLLSFPPGSPAIELRPLNVLIGPNGSGKSNLIEATVLLRALPTGFATAIRQGGGIGEWLWKGDSAAASASLETLFAGTAGVPELAHRIRFAAVGPRAEIVEESLDAADRLHGEADQIRSLFRNSDGKATILVRTPSSGHRHEELGSESLSPAESLLSQVRDSRMYPELTSLAKRLHATQVFREWSFGALAEVRKPQATDLQGDQLLPDSRNLGLLLNQVENSKELPQFNKMMSVFLPRFERFSTRVVGGMLQFFVHERGLGSSIPSSRLSDGTLRFLALLALLHSPAPPPILCIEEPELGLHPDSLSLMAELLVDASGRMQLLVTTHSDALVSALTEHTESVLVCENLRGTVINRLDPGKLEYWLNRYRLGEIWRLGELGGNP